MNLETAIQRAADWWMEQIAGGKWDNSDPHTEFQHAIFAAITPGPTALQLPALREAIIDAIRSQQWENSINGTVSYQLYADYGCCPIDDAAKARGLTFSSMLHGPQKAGTTIDVDEHGNATLSVKSGYGTPWETVEEHEAKGDAA